MPYEESSRGVDTGKVVGDLAGSQHPLDTVGPQLVPLGTVGVAQTQAHLLLFSVHCCGLLQNKHETVRSDIEELKTAMGVF